MFRTFFPTDTAKAVPPLEGSGLSTCSSQEFQEWVRSITLESMITPAFVHDLHRDLGEALSCQRKHPQYSTCEYFPTPPLEAFNDYSRD